ncbi:MAG: HepT-like ribonuclease domain-containing protein [Pseudomonadota bacterium]
MRNDDLVRLRHMINAALEAMLFAKGRKREDLDEDRMLTLALVKAIEIIGEAASKMSPELRVKHPEIPWQAILGMRNKLVHAYFQINLDIVWLTTINELPGLIRALADIVQSE